MKLNIFKKLKSPPPPQPPPPAPKADYGRLLAEAPKDDGVAVAPAPGAPSLFPRFHSRFGGLWVDLSNALELLEGKLELGVVTEAEAERLRAFIRDGYIVIEKAVPLDVIDQLNEDVKKAWRGEFPGLHIEYWENGVMKVELARPELEARQTKMLDLFAHSAAARRAMLAAPIRRFLQLVFERPPLAFQSLYFTRGSQQPIHQDTAYVVIGSPMELAASWIALEDIGPNTGELEYYAGSHKIAEHLFQGRFKSKPLDTPVGDTEHARYLESLHEKSKALGCERKQFRPKRGDALIWHADLAHGGSQVMDPGSTRKSFVTHYCPANLDPAYYAYAKNSGKVRFEKGAYYTHVIR